MNNFNPYMNNGMMGNMYQPFNPMQSRLNSLNQQKQELENQINMLQSQMPQTPIVQNFQLTPQGQQNFDFNGSFVEKEEDVNNIKNDTTKPLFLMNKNKNEFYIKNPDGTVQIFNFEQKEQFEKMTLKNNDNLENQDIKKMNDDIIAIFGVLNTLQGNFDKLVQIIANSQNNAKIEENEQNIECKVEDENKSSKNTTKTTTKVAK